MTIIFMLCVFAVCASVIILPYILVDSGKDVREKNKKHTALAIIEIETAHGIASRLKPDGIIPKTITVKTNKDSAEVLLECSNGNGASLKELRKIYDIPGNWKILQENGSTVIKVEWQGRIYGYRREFLSDIWNEIKKQHPEWIINGNTLYFDNKNADDR